MAYIPYLLIGLYVFFSQRFERCKCKNNLYNFVHIIVLFNKTCVCICTYVYTHKHTHIHVIFHRNALLLQAHITVFYVLSK